MGQKLPIFMDDVPNYRVKGDNMHIKFKELEIVLPVGVMLAGMAQAQVAIEDWRAQRADVVPIKGRRRKH